MKTLKATLTIVGIGLLMAASSARADTFQFTSDHCTGGCGTPPFGTVTLLQNGTTVDVTVSLAAGFFWAKTGAADFMEFKFNGAPSLASITVDQTFPGQTLAAATGNFSGDGTGFFAFGIACTTCGNGNLSPLNQNIVFHVANTTLAQLENANSSGNIFVADVFSSQTGNTGPVDVSGTPVPDATLLLALASTPKLFCEVPVLKRALLLYMHRASQAFPRLGGARIRKPISVST
jgi:hypothetical protein